MYQTLKKSETDQLMEEMARLLALIRNERSRIND